MTVNLLDQQSKVVCVTITLRGGIKAVHNSRRSGPQSQETHSEMGASWARWLMVARKGWSEYVTGCSSPGLSSQLALPSVAERIIN